MGVSRKEKIELTPIKIENNDYFNHEDYDLSESGDETDYHARRISIEQLPPLRLRTFDGKKDPNRGRKFEEELETGGVNMKKNMGSRKWRRVEHARALLTFAELEDICEDCSDICSQPYTAFDKLFNDRQNMKIWNEFTQKEEVEQWRILENKSQVDVKKQQSGSGWCMLGGKGTPTKKSNAGSSRKHHPAYTGKMCYERIDMRCRSVLAGRKVNWALVDHLEAELRELFSNSSDIGNNDGEVVFVANYPASSDRLLAHIVSQYLWLSSQSVTDPETKERMTEIRNPRVFFIPPHTTLIAHLEEEVLKRKIDFIPYSMRDIEKENGSSITTRGTISENMQRMNLSNDSSSDEEWVKMNKTSE